ncbi:MAG: hypothetical protein AAGA70_11340 [Pseudomonadota bacterium]
MTWLVWTGTALTLLGLCIVIFCIVVALRLRRSGLEDAELKSRLQRVVALNMGALLLSALGLMSVVLAVMLA